MPIGGSEGSLEIRDDRDLAYSRARSALASVGKVVEEDQAEGFLRGSARYGLQKVRLKINVETADEKGSLVRIRAQADDVWGKAARTVVRRVFDALEDS